MCFIFFCQSYPYMFPSPMEKQLDSDTAVRNTEEFINPNFCNFTGVFYTNDPSFVVQVSIRSDNI